MFITCQVKSHKTDSIKRIEKNLIESFEKIKTFFSSDKYLLIKLDQGGLKIHETLIIIIRVVADECVKQETASHTQQMLFILKLVSFLDLLSPPSESCLVRMVLLNL